MISSLVVVLLILISYACLAEEKSAVSYLDASVSVPEFFIPPAPAEGAKAATNPPSFRWLPEPGAVSYILQYSARKDFSGGSTVTVEGIKLNLHHPAKTIKPGKWHWRYRISRADGSASEWSAVRSFTMPKDAVEFILPPVEDVLARIPKGRPRLFLRPEDVEPFRRARLADRKEEWAELQKLIDQQLDKPVMKEPAPYPNGKWNVDMWREYMAQARGMGSRVEHLAFGYLMTGDRKYADAAKAQILEICTWDPQGMSSWKGNDEVAMPIILSTSRAYDWIYDTLTPEEREKIRDMIRIRAGDVYHMLRGIPYEAKPFASHQTRVLKFLGQASISFLGEISEAGEWFEWLMSVFYCIYPPWGGTDGSYHEGPNYWSAYFSWAQQFATALKSATGIDLYQKPFFRNTGYWALYCIPPHGAMTPFGDGTTGKTGVGHKMNLYRLSSVYDDPYLRWYVDAIPDKLGPSMIMYLWRDDSVASKPPTDIPQSRAFPDCGLAAMHSDLAGGKNDVYMLLKSDPYGSWSHNYADQNSLYLQAFGEPLAIPSGYYPWYGSPHHSQWTWQTKAHNSILVNGEGQVPRRMSSRGRITGSLFSPWFDYACGDATEAYGGRLSKFLRHVLFVRSDYFVIIDELEAKDPSTFRWLLHSWEKMSVGDSQATVSKGDARLLVRFVEPEKIEISQTDQFTVPPEREGLANQWHLTASTTIPARERCFVTVLYPYKSGEEASLPKIERLEAPGASAVSIISGKSRDTIVLNRLDSSLAGLGIKSDARIVAVRDQGDSPKAVFMLAGTFFGARSELVRADSPVSLAMEVSEGIRSAVVQCSRKTEIRLAMPEARDKGLMGATLGKMGRSPITDDMLDPRLFRGTVRVDGRRLSEPEFTFDHETGVLIFRILPGEHRVEAKLA
jgi:hypothetical protein